MKQAVIIAALMVAICAGGSMSHAEELRGDPIIYKINSVTNFTFTNNSSRAVSIGAFIGTVSAASTQTLTFTHIDSTKAQTNAYLPVVSTNVTELFINYATLRGVWHKKGAVIEISTTSIPDIDGMIFLVK